MLERSVVLKHFLIKIKAQNLYECSYTGKTTCAVCVFKGSNWRVSSLCRFLQTLEKNYIIINSNFTVCTGNACIKKKSKLKVVLLISSDPLPLLLAKLNCVIVCILHVLILLTMVEGDNSF